MNPRTSATAANVSAGLKIATTPPMISSVPSAIQTQRHLWTSDERMKYWIPAPMNIAPMMIPTTSTDFSVNWMMTRDRITQMIPITSQTHQ